MKKYELHKINLSQPAILIFPQTKPSSETFLSPPAKAVSDFYLSHRAKGLQGEITRLSSDEILNELKNLDQHIIARLCRLATHNVRL